jgi:hypothetical protein
MTSTSPDLPRPNWRGFSRDPTMSRTIIITVRPRERHLSAERALEILGAARVRGCTGAALLDHGFCTGMLADLVRDVLATARLESMTGKHKIAVARVRITNAGQMALEDAAASE